ncbi:MAG: hypothetical protein LAT58_11645 [Opitutales bacterium]|nr:hypothetical protein [Opitutales bacterium]
MSYRCFVPLLLFLAFAATVSAHNLRPRMPVAVEQGASVYAEDRSTVERQGFPGEVATVRQLDGEWVEIQSPINELGTGWVKASALSRSNPRDLNAFRRQRSEILEQFEQAAAAEQAQQQDALLAELAAADQGNQGMASALGPVHAQTSTFVPRNQVVAGYFSLGGRSTDIVDISVSEHGDVYLLGQGVGLDYEKYASVLNPFLDQQPDPSYFERRASYTFIARLSRDLSEIADLRIAPQTILSGPERIVVNQKGHVYLLVGSHALDVHNEKIISPSDVHGGNESWRVLVFTPDFSELVTAGGVERLFPHVAGFEIDSKGRPLFFSCQNVRRRDSSPVLTRLHSNPIAEAPFAKANGESRIVFNLHEAPFTDADNPFSIWGSDRNTYPPTATPIAKFGSSHNEGDEIKWGGSSGGGATSNPYVLLNLMSENMAIDKEGNIILGGTVPHNMPMPGFDAFLASYSPDGELRWGNILLDGFLSEPDQKNQAIAIDPSNGDILVSFRQHGNNVHSMILHPDGFLRQFTGTQGDIMITWIGRIDADSGQLKNSTYMYSRMPRNFEGRWPDLSNYFMYGNGNLAVDNDGYVYVSGAARNVSPTTRNAYIPQSEFDSHVPVLHVLTPDLSQLSYGTYLAETTGRTLHTIPFPDGTIFNAGEVSDRGTFHTQHTDQVNYLSSTPPSTSGDNTFIVLLKPEKGGQRHQWKMGPSPQSQE